MVEPFDKNELMEELDHDLEFLEETFEMLNQDSVDLLHSLTTAVADNDSGAVASAAHTIKSMVGNFCAAPAQQAALELEMLGKSGDLAEAPAKLEGLRTELERLKSGLKELIKGLE